MTTGTETAGSAKPASPTDLGARGWLRMPKRVFAGFQRNALADRAAALTYYAVLSVFPALVALVSLLGLFGQADTVESVLDVVDDLGPASAVDTLRGPVETMVDRGSGAGLFFVVGLAGALWSASGYTGAFGRAANAVWEVEEGRPFWKRRPLELVITVLLLVLAGTLAIAIVFTGPLAETVGDVIGLGDLALTVWAFAKWPVMALIVIAILCVLYTFTPNVKMPRFRWITPGAVLAVIVWAIASAGFALYVANFGSYDATYGALAAVIVFLLWMWITNLAFLVGLQLDAELERERELQAGLPAETELQLPERSAPKKPQRRPPPG
jgi:membrane protein